MSEAYRICPLPWRKYRAPGETVFSAKLFFGVYDVGKIAGGKWASWFNDGSGPVRVGPDTRTLRESKDRCDQDYRRKVRGLLCPISIDRKD